MTNLLKRAKEIKELINGAEQKIKEVQEEMNTRSYKEICEFISEFNEFIDYEPIESSNFFERKFETVDSITWRNCANKYKEYKKDELSIAKGIKVSKTIPVIVQNGVVCECSLYLMDDGKFYMLDDIYNRKGINGPIDPSVKFAGDFITNLYPTLSEHSWDLVYTKKILSEIMEKRLHIIENKYKKIKVSIY